MCIHDTVTGLLIELFLICDYTLFELMGPLGLSVSRLYASSGGSRPWGPATMHHMVSEPTGSRFPEEVAVRQMVEVDVDSSRLRTLQDDEQTDSDGDQTRRKM